MSENSESFACNWIANLLSVSDRTLSTEIKSSIMKECASMHLRSSGVKEIAAQYRGNLDGFIQMLSEKWHWIVAYDPITQVITANENKSECICPIAQKISTPVSGTLCYCSEGFAERMFSIVLERPVRARVIQSVLRGANTCIYSIQ
jgi:hypothetical protein